MNHSSSGLFYIKIFSHLSVIIIIWSPYTQIIMALTTVPTYKPSFAATLSLLFLRFWLTICTILFVLNTINVFYLRFTKTPLSEILHQSASTFSFYDSAALLYIFSNARNVPLLAHHVWPVPLWLALMFSQLSTYIRRRYIRLHRISGRIAIVISIYMTTSVIWMLATSKDLNGPVGFSFDLKNPRKVFSFWSSCSVFIVYWMYCLYQMYSAIKMKNIQDHKYWALHFVATGFGPGSLRVMNLIYFIFLRYWYPEYQMDVEAHKTMMGYFTWAAFCGSVMFVDLLISTGVIQAGKKAKGK